MKVSEISREEMQAFVESEDFSLIVQKNHEKYKMRWLKWVEKKEKIKFGTTQSWNWWGILFGEFWLLYRKMYMWAVICIIIRILAILQQLFLPQYNSIFQISGMIPNMLIALLSYDWYLNKVYLLYLTFKEEKLGQLSEKVKDSYTKQGGTSLKYLLIYLGAFVLFISLFVFGAMYSSSGNYNSSSSASSSYSDNIDAIRGSVLAFDESIYLGNALEGYPFFTSHSWEELTTAQGRKIVRFTGKYDLKKELVITKTDTTSKRISEVDIIFGFTINVDNTSFNLYSVDILVDNKPVYPSGTPSQDFAFDLLENVYNSQPFELSIVLLLSFGTVLVHDLPIEDVAPSKKEIIPIQNNSEDLSLVQKGTLSFDNGVTIGKALDNYPYFSATTWEEFTNEQGRKVVRFIGDYNIKAEIAKMIEFGATNAEEFFTGVSSASLIIDFSISQDKKSFSLYQGQLMLNEKSEFLGQADYAEYLLQPIYTNSPFLGSLLKQ